MAELNTKLNCKKDGVTEEITAYTTLDEVQNTGIGITIGGIEGYIKYGDASDANASQLNCKVPNDDATYRVHLTAVQPVTLNLVCKNVEDDTILTTVKYIVPDDGVLYLNNDNAPSVSGYDFVLLDGIKHTGVVEDDVFTVYYVDNTIANRTKTSWMYYFSNQTSITETPVINTYSATDMSSMFFYCSNLTSVPQMNTSNVTNMSDMFYECSALTSVPQMDTSNVTNMYGMFHYCSNLTSVPQMDTSKATNMNYMFYYCKALTSIDWEIDMSSCTNCNYMFNSCPATNIRLKNVPSSLDLSSIGTTNYTVVNYI